MFRLGYRFAAFTFVLLIASMPSLADPIVIGQTATIHSKILDEDRSLRIYLPPLYGQSKQHYPVLYLPDAETRFLHTAGTVAALAQAGHIPQMIIVGIDNTQRTLNLTPKWTTEVAEGDTLATFGPQGGGADDFLRFFREELFPWVDQNYRTVPYRILIGHSFGGLFAVHTFVAQPEAFNAIIAISPTLSWDNEGEFRGAKELFASRPSLRGRLFLTMGNEGDPMHASFQKFEDLLRTMAPEGVRWDAHVLNTEDHGSVPVPTVDLGLEWIYSRWRLPQFALQQGLDGIDQHFASLSNEFGYPIHTPEATVNRVGYQSLGAGDMKKAIAIFERNVRDFPESPNVYDSLGEALEGDGQLQRAREQYQRAWQMGMESGDPNAKTYKAHVDRVAAKMKK